MMEDVRSHLPSSITFAPPKEAESRYVT